MADLLKALQQSYYTPQDTGYGIASQVISQSTPAFYNPYASTGQNLATGIGGALVSGLLGGMARGSAAKRNAEMLPQIQQIFNARPEDRMAIAGDNQRLTPLIAALRANQFEQKQKQQDMINQKMIDMQYNPLIKSQDIYAQNLAEQGKYIIQDPQTGQVRQVPAGQVGMLDPYEQRQKIIQKEGEATFETPQAKFQTSSGLRKEFDNSRIVKEFELTDQGLRALEKAVLDPSAMSSVEIVRRAIQAIEPGLAVRTDDQVDVAARQALPEKLYAQFRQAYESKEGLSAEARMGLLNIARRARTEKAKDFNTRLNRYQKLAKDAQFEKNIYGYEPAEIFDYSQDDMFDRINIKLNPDYIPQPRAGESKEDFRMRVKQLGSN